MKTCNPKYEALIADAVRYHLHAIPLRVTPVPTYPDTIVYEVQLPHHTVMLKAVDPEGRDPDGIALEAWACETARAANIPAPYVRAVDTSRNLLPCSFFIMDKARGQPLSDFALPFADQRPFLHELGHVLHELHTIHVAGFGWLDEAHYAATGVVRGRATTWADAILHDIPRSLEYLAQAGAIDSGIETMIQQFVQNYNTYVQYDKVGSLLHGDIGANHVWVDPERRMITSLVDFGERKAGDPVWDIVEYDWAAVKTLVEGYEPEAAMAAAFDTTFYLYAMLRAVPWAATWHQRGATHTVEGLKHTVHAAQEHLI